MPTKFATVSVRKAAPSFISCKLNDIYKQALKRKRFKFENDHMTHNNTYWAAYYDGLLDTKNDGFISTDMMDGGSLQCCGIDELDFQNDELEAYSRKTNLPSEDWEELIAKYIKHMIGALDDKRIVIVGIPTKNTNGHNSQYNFQYYNKLLKTLLRFGFVQCGKQYVNNNSKNMLSVLVAQLP